MADAKSTTSASVKKRTPRPFYVAMQILDEHNTPVKFDKSQINIVAASQNAGVILDAMEGGENPHVLYKKVTPSA